MRKKSYRRKVTARQQYNFLHSVRLFKGDAMITVILAIVVIAGVFLAGGALPRQSRDTQDLSSEAVIDEDSLASSTNGNQLQLKTLKFKKCSSVAAVTMMLDRSGSMSGKKIQTLKEATLSFTSNFADESVIGIQSFNTADIREDVPVSYYKNVKDLIIQKVNALEPGSTTPTYGALQFSRDILTDAIPKFPGKSFNYIFLSDGLPVPPETQDPRDYTPNPADEIKAMGVTIFTIGIFGAADSGPGGELLKSIASDPSYYFSTPTGDDLSRIYEAIGTKICNKATK